MMRAEWRARRRSIAALLAVTLLAVACGGDDGGDNSVPLPAPAIALVAGSLQRAGSQDGAGAVAQFNGPRGVAQDSAGNAYVADTGNHTIRKIAPDGTVTTWAGAAGQAGSVDGAAQAARFSSPRGLAIDAAGNIYVADSGNHTVRKVSAGGVVSTVAGTAGQPGSVDGSAAVARLQSPSDVAVDAAGNLYVVTTNAVRKVAPDGSVTTFATQQSLPITAVATDGAGNVYVAESPPATSLGVAAGAVRRFSSTGVLLPWGTAADGSVAVNFPTGLAADAAGNVFVTASGDQLFTASFHFSTRMIIKITPAGQVETVSGAVNDVRTIEGPVASARFRDPHGISVGPVGRLVITETLNSAVRQIDAQGIVSTLAGGGDGFIDGQGGAARFFGPVGLAADADGTLYVADAGNKAVRRIGPFGSVTTLPMTGDTCPATQQAALSPDGTLYIEGGVTSFVYPMCAMDPASGASRFYANNRYTTAIGVDAAGRVLVGASSLERINGDGSRQVLASGFNQIGGIAADPSGVIYVSDNVDHTVQSVSSDGVVMLLAGQAGKPGYADGIGANAQLNYPGAITLDAVGNLYVADATTIRRITPQGEVRTIAGVPGQSGVQPGPALASPIGRVSGLAWFSGALYATVQNAVIRIAPLN